MSAGVLAGARCACGIRRDGAALVWITHSCVRNNDDVGDASVCVVLAAGPRRTAMTAATFPGLNTSGDNPPTRHAELFAWVTEVAELTQPDRVVFADGSDAEWERLTTQLVEAGTFTKLDEAKKPNSYLALSDPADVARVESRTFICTETEEGAGPTNNCMDPAEMRTLMRGLYQGCMRGRTMYVVPFCMGPLGSDDPKLGIEITDSPYVVLSMRI